MMMFNKYSSTLAIVLALGAAPALAQTDKTSDMSKATDAGKATNASKDMDTSGNEQANRTQQRDGQQNAGNTGGEDSQAVVLDIEGFSEALYERGFRQGYLRGVADARQRLATEMQGERQRRMARSGDGMDQNGAVVILPHGMTPQMFIAAVQQQSDDAQRGQSSNRGETGEEMNRTGENANQGSSEGTMERSSNEGERNRQEARAADTSGTTTTQ